MHVARNLRIGPKSPTRLGEEPEWKASGLSQKEFCRQRSLSDRALNNWLYKSPYRERVAQILAARSEVKPSAETPRFLPVSLLSEDRVDQRQLHFPTFCYRHPKSHVPTKVSTTSRSWRNLNNAMVLHPNQIGRPTECTPLQPRTRMTQPYAPTLSANLRVLPPKRLMPT